MPGQATPPYGADERGVAAGQRQEYTRTDGKTDSRIYSVRIQVGDRPAALVVAQLLKPTKELLTDLALVLILISGAGVVVAALAGTAVARTGLRPVERLTRATERVARTGDLRPIQVSGDDELAHLTHSFNTMLGAVADARDRQRSLVADAGHELRTPLTSLRTNLELLMASECRRPDLSDQDKSEIQDDLRGQLDELTQLIGDLVELAREEGAQAIWEPVELGRGREQSLDRARRRCRRDPVRGLLEPWRFIGDTAALERAVLNLLDNAVKFSPPNGVVRVRLGPTRATGSPCWKSPTRGRGSPRRICLACSTASIALRRRGRCRARGLGLAIVQQAALRHGGEVLAGRSPEGGALFSLRLPGMPG